MRGIIADLIAIGIVVGFVGYAYFAHRVSDLPKRSGGGGKSRPAKRTREV